MGVLSESFSKKAEDETVSSSKWRARVALESKCMLSRFQEVKSRSRAPKLIAYPAPKHRTGQPPSDLQALSSGFGQGSTVWGTEE